MLCWDYQAGNATLRNEIVDVVPEGWSADGYRKVTEVDHDSDGTYATLRQRQHDLLHHNARVLGLHPVEVKVD